MTLMGHRASPLRGLLFLSRRKISRKTSGTAVILPLVSRWEVMKLTNFLHNNNFVGFCSFNCRIWSLVRCSLSIFFGPAGGRARRSNDEFVLWRIRFTLSECGNVKTCMLNVSNKWIIFVLSFRAVFITGCHQKNCWTSTYFQYRLGQVYLTRHETDIQKRLWPGLITPPNYNSFCSFPIHNQSMPS